MAEILELSDAEFAEQMHGLVHQAERALEDRATAARHADREREAHKDTQDRAVKSMQSLPQILRPVVVGLEALSRAQGENTQILQRLDRATPPAEAGGTDQLAQIAKDLQGVFEQKNAVTRAMFDALHQELRSYKDGFLLETVHRPMIRDLITLYDDLADIRRLVAAVLADTPREERPEAGAPGERLHNVHMHLEHRLEFIVEVLARLEVSPMPESTGRLDKRTQRAMSIVRTEEAERDLEVVRTLKKGFWWKDRIVRPEEVVILRWQESAAAPL